MNLQVGETPQWGLAGKQVNIGEKYFFVILAPRNLFGIHCD
jgi:hypothetical protein